MLKEAFTNLFAGFGASPQLIQKEWDWLAAQYESKQRYYHNLEHLAHMYKELKEARPVVKDWNTLLCSLFYHDVVYQPLSKQNEQRSADKAAESLGKFGVKQAMINKCRQQILATRNHQPGSDEDTNYLLDADLAILGAPWPLYEEYAGKIRKEYRVVPSLVYRQGRKKVLEHFLAMQSIYKTELAKEMYETQARENLEQEIAMLTS